MAFRSFPGHSYSVMRRFFPVTTVIGPATRFRLCDV